MKLMIYLKRLGVCREAISWAVDYATLPEAWAACERPDWMLWFVARLDDYYSPRLRLVACAIARIALKHVPAGENRPRLAIECAERFSRDEATAQELAAARAAAETAAGAAAVAAAGAAWAAARAAAWAAARTTTGVAVAAAASAGAAAGASASAAARAAAQAAAEAAEGAAEWAAARADAEAEQCRIIRDMIPQPDNRIASDAQGGAK